MPVQAENVLLVYRTQTRELQRIIILDFKHQEDFPEWAAPDSEKILKVPLSVYNSWTTDEVGHLQHRAEAYVQQNAP